MHRILWMLWTLLYARGHLWTLVDTVDARGHCGLCAVLNHVGYHWCDMKSLIAPLDSFNIKARHILILGTSY